MLVVILIIVDLDRPRRGIIQVSHTSLTELQAALSADQSYSEPVPEQTVTTSTPVTPDYVDALKTAYGAPSQTSFGSAVFYEPIDAEYSLAEAALAKYRVFVGDLWERYGENAWMTPWKEVYTRTPGTSPDIVAELRGITDPDAVLSAPMILEAVENADTARAALSAAFDDPGVTELRVFNLGDGEAMSGLLVASRRAETGDATFLVFLLD